MTIDWSGIVHILATLTELLAAAAAS